MRGDLQKDIGRLQVQMCYRRVPAMDMVEGAGHTIEDVCKRCRSSRSVCHQRCLCIALRICRGSIRIEDGSQGAQLYQGRYQQHARWVVILHNGCDLFARRVAWKGGRLAFAPKMQSRFGAVLAIQGRYKESLLAVSNVQSK